MLIFKIILPGNSTYVKMLTEEKISNFFKYKLTLPMQKLFYYTLVFYCSLI